MAWMLLFVLALLLANVKSTTGAPMNAPRKPFMKDDSAHEIFNEAAGNPSGSNRVPWIVDIKGHDDQGIDVDMLLVDGASADPFSGSPTATQHAPHPEANVNHPPNGRCPVSNAMLANSAAYTVNAIPLGDSVLPADGASSHASNRPILPLSRQHSVPVHPRQASNEPYDHVPPIGYHTLLMGPNANSDHVPSTTFSMARYAARYIAKLSVTQIGHIRQFASILVDSGWPLLTAVDANRLLIMLSKASSRRDQAMAVLRLFYGEYILPSTISLVRDSSIRNEMIRTMFQAFDNEMVKPTVDEQFMFSLCASPLIDEQESITGDTVYLRAVKLNRPDIFVRIGRCGCNPFISDWQGVTAASLLERANMDRPLRSSPTAANDARPHSDIRLEDQQSGAINDNVDVDWDEILTYFEATFPERNNGAI